MVNWQQNATIYFLFFFVSPSKQSPLLSPVSSKGGHGGAAVDVVYTHIHHTGASIRIENWRYPWQRNLQVSLLSQLPLHNYRKPIRKMGIYFLSQTQWEASIIKTADLGVFISPRTDMRLTPALTDVNTWAAVSPPLHLSQVQRTRQMLWLQITVSVLLYWTCPP